MAADWPGADPTNLRLNADGVLVTEDTNVRTFRVERDYLYPIPLEEITLSGGTVTQNPNWQ